MTPQDGDRECTESAATAERELNNLAFTVGDYMRQARDALYVNPEKWQHIKSAKDAIAAHTRAAVERETAELRARKDDDRFHWIMAHCTEAVEIYEEHIEGYNPPIPPVTDAEAVVVQLRAKLTAAEGTVAELRATITQLEKDKVSTTLMLITRCQDLTAAEATVAQLRTRLDTARDALETIRGLYERPVPMDNVAKGIEFLNRQVEQANDLARAALSSIREGETKP